MKREHVTTKFQAWNDERVAEDERRDIERHLGECDNCRTYFTKMSLLMEKPDPSLLPRLEADPFLSTRVRALADGQKTSTAGATATVPAAPASAAAAGRRPFGWISMSFMSAAVVVALMAGVYFGKGLSELQTPGAVQGTQTQLVQSDGGADDYSDSDVIDAYYDAFSQPGFADDWETVLEEGNGES
jgi:anti-sigma factor RsiW